MRKLILSCLVLTFAAPFSSAGGKKGGDAPKVIAKFAATVNGFQGTTPAAYRSASELPSVKAGHNPKLATAELAKQFKVDAIDWDKQMVLTLPGGRRNTGGFSVEVKDLKVKGKELLVNWAVKSPPPDAFVTRALTNPAVTVLVPRHDGKIVFDPPLAR